ncbi:hypothetical protein BJ875DRAFT_498954 [Amylocarpus encephaloides]|uniref:Uncharacterized protein n=1 Tax=Amylocarpus encephaloides TaxID=45428 RepID=A0A9P8C256_9HELO|nr:hypothetical protein BJ875DRAFT_498954 [Amylocarpus encephaloides]
MDFSLMKSPFDRALLNGNMKFVNSELRRIRKTKAARESKASRKAKLRQQSWIRKLPEDNRELVQKNPDLLGLPRGYTIDILDTDGPIKTKHGLDGALIVFSQFGTPEGTIALNNYLLENAGSEFDPVLKAYTFGGRARRSGKKRNGIKESVELRGRLEFSTSKPTGYITMQDQTFRVALTASRLMYNVQVSHQSGAYFAVGSGLNFTPSSTDWIDGPWFDEMEFEFGVTYWVDEITQESRAFTEQVFRDKLGPENNDSFDLSLDKLDPFNPVAFWNISWAPGDVLTTTITSQVPALPAWRDTKPVRTVFPDLSKIDFTSSAFSFNGAYRCQVDGVNQVYGMQGSLNWLARDGLPETGASSLVTGVDMDTTSFARAAVTSPSIGALIGMNPMTADFTDPQNPVYHDEIGDLAMADFHDIIVYHMEDELREKFVQEFPINLIPEVQAIADDDPGNQAFYRTLQLPFIGQRLSTATQFDRHGEINGRRCEALLRKLPAESEVYERHSQKLFDYRFKHRFPAMQLFQDDQEDSHLEHVAVIDNIGNYFKTQLNDVDAGAASPDDEYQANVAAEQDRIDQLVQWAKEKKLYWCMRLLYEVDRFVKPAWADRIFNGGGNQLTLEMKKWNALMTQLEGNQLNPNGPSFVQFLSEKTNEYFATNVYPQLVDLEGCADEYGEIMLRLLSEMATQYKNNDNPDLAELADLAEEMLGDDGFLLDQFKAQLFAAQKSLQTGYSYFLLHQEFVAKITALDFIQSKPNASGLIKTFMVGTALAFLVLAGTGGDFSELAVGDKVNIIVNSMILGGAIFLKAAKSLISIAESFVSFFATKAAAIMATYGGPIRGILGKGLANAPSTFALVSRSIHVPSSAPTISVKFTKARAMLGKYAGRAAATIAGAIISVITVIFIAIDLAQNHGEMDDLQLAFNSFFLIAATIEILVAGASMLISAAGTTAAALIGGIGGALGPALGALATFGGPVAIAIAIIGLIIFFIWFARQKPPPDPVEVLIGRLKSHSPTLVMDEDKLAVEYFSYTPHTESRAENLGVSVKGIVGTYNINSTSSFISPNVAPKRFLSVAPEGSSNPAAFNSTMTFGPNDVWNLDTDEKGRTRISAFRPTSTGSLEEYFLVIQTSGSSVTVNLAKPPPTDDSGYNGFMERAIWSVKVVSATDIEQPDEDEGGHPVLLKALCVIYRVTSLTSHIYPRFDTDSNQLSVSTNKAAAPVYEFQLRPRFAGALDYAHNPWSLFTFEMDEYNLPTFAYGSQSAGLAWTISPAPPAPLEFVSEKGTKEGLIRMEIGEPFQGPFEGSYTVSCALPSENAAPISTTVQISVSNP